MPPESRERHCTQCGEPQPADARFCPRCGLAVVAAGAADPVVGKVVADRYLIVEKLGQGTSGTIYRAEHTTLRKKVAVKILHIQLSQDETAIERFRREATTVGQIENDHILQVLDFGRTDDKRLFFAMEFLEGQTLAAAIFKDTKLPVDRTVDIASQVADALVEAHGLGYVHRDLRPRNIFLTTRRGKPDFVKLLDFGLAKLVLPSATGDHKQTALGMTFGDARYMSPEQARGEAVDRRADVYSLGCMMFEMLAGAPPFAGTNTFDVIQKQLDQAPPKLRSLRPDCPAWLEAVIERALGKTPDSRFPTMLKLVESLRNKEAPPALASAPAPAEKPKPAGPSPEDTRQTAQIPSQRDAPVADSPQYMRDTLRDPLKSSDVAQHMRDTLPTTPAPVAKPDTADTKVDIKVPDPRGNAPTLQTPTIAPPPETPSQTQALGSVPRAPAPGPQQRPTDKSGKKKRPHVPREIAQVAGNPAMTRSGEVTALKSEGGNKPPTGPTVVVDGAGSSVVAKAAAAAGVPSKREDSGEWFAQSGAFQKADPLLDDEELYEPRKNRSGLILGGVAGGLGLVVVVVMLLLPKPVKKPLHGEDAPAADAPKMVVTPVATPIADKPIDKPVDKPLDKIQPADAPKVDAPKADVPVAELKPDAQIQKPAPDSQIQKPSKPEPKPEPVKVAKPEPKADRPEPKADKPAKVEPATAKASDGRKKKDLPEGFVDPFASGAAKPSVADAAQADFFIKLGRQKLGSSDLSGAATNFNKAREFDSRSAEAFAGLGEVAFEQGDYNGASVNLKQALKLSPNRARVVILLGQAYYKMNKPKEAIDQYKRALRLDPSNAEAQHSLELAEKKLQ